MRAVEAALLTPLVVPSLIGMMEMSLFLRDGVAVNSAVRSAARVACRGGRRWTRRLPAVAQPTAVHFGDGAGLRPGRRGRRPAGREAAMPANAITAITVYEANAAGYPPPEGNTAIVAPPTASPTSGTPPWAASVSAAAAGRAPRSTPASTASTRTPSAWPSAPATPG